MNKLLPLPVIIPPPPVVLIVKGDPNCDHVVVMDDHPGTNAHGSRFYSGTGFPPYREWSCRICWRTVRQEIPVPPEPKLRMPEPT
jgi:hypothetical protein